MSYLRPSRDVDLVRPVIACFVAVYGAEFGRGACAEIDRERGGEGKRGDLGGRRIIKKKKFISKGLCISTLDCDAVGKERSPNCSDAGGKAPAGANLHHGVSWLLGFSHVGWLVLLAVGV